jgi:glycogen debranching enzyme
LRIAAQQQASSGMLPHEVYLEPGTAINNWPDGDGQASSITQLPIFAHAVWETYLVTRNRELIADILPVLLRYDDWIARERDRDGDGLMSLMHRWSGWDTSPRWDFGLDIEAVDATSYWFAQKQAIANIARELGDDALAEKYSQEAEHIAQTMRAKMWDDDAKNFWDLQGADEMPVRVRTPAPFVTLPFGIADAMQAKALSEQIADPKLFWSKFPIPSVALNEITFDPNDYWRGPVWFNQNWLALDGLRRYGYEDLAAQLLARSLDMLKHSGQPSAYEYFNPLTGGDLGALDFGWTGLCNDMIVRHVCGVQRTDADWKFTPLDIGLDWYELDLPAQEIHVRYDRATGYRVTR